MSKKWEPITIDIDKLDKQMRENLSQNIEKTLKDMDIVCPEHNQYPGVKIVGIPGNIKPQITGCCQTLIDIANQAIDVN